MALETGNYISDLDPANPAGTDTLDKADDHLRLIKSTVKATFPNILGAVTPTHTELNFVDGVTSSIQTQLNAKAALVSPTFTGTPAAPTAAVDTNTTQLATTAYVVGQGYAKLASPTFTGTVTIPTLALTNDLTVANGGTGVSTLTGIVKGNGASAFTAAVAGTDYVAPTALSAYAPLASPALTGNPTAPTPTAGDNDTSIATTAFVQTAIAGAGMNYLGTITTTSGTSQALGSLSLGIYQTLHMVVAGVSHNSGGSPFLTVNGTQFTATHNSSAAQFGFLDIDLSTGVATALVDENSAADAAIRILATTVNTATTTITIAVSGGSFDAGSINVYGVA